MRRGLFTVAFLLAVSTIEVACDESGVAPLHPSLTAAEVCLCS